jgi:hypothetical protein
LRRQNERVRGLNMIEVCYVHVLKYDSETHFKRFERKLKKERLSGSQDMKE